MSNGIPSNDPLDDLLRYIQRGRSGVARGIRPGLPGRVDLGGTVPLSTQQLLDAGGTISGTFSIGATAGDLVNLDIGIYANLNSALRDAYSGGLLEFDATRNGGSNNVARGSGEIDVVVNFYNGSGRGTFPYAWCKGSINDGDEFRRLGVTVDAYIASDDLVVQLTNTLGLGGTIEGQFRWKPREEI